MNENSTWLLERRRKAQDEAERSHVATPMPPAAASDADRGDRVLRTCSTCRAAGLLEESKGHIALGHETWLTSQAAHVQAHFKGQGAPADLEPRLVKATAAAASPSVSAWSVGRRNSGSSEER
jgi:hypothetical protein